MLPPKNRKISDSIANPIFFEDPARLICEALGKEFLHDVGAIALHRVGLLSGIGWRIPYGAHKDGLGYVRIWKPAGAKKYSMEFAKIDERAYGGREDSDLFQHNDRVAMVVENMFFVTRIDGLELEDIADAYRGQCNV